MFEVKKVMAVIVDYDIEGLFMYKSFYCIGIRRLRLYQIRDDARSVLDRFKYIGFQVKLPFQYVFDRSISTQCSRKNIGTHSSELLIGRLVMKPSSDGTSQPKSRGSALALIR